VDAPSGRLVEDRTGDARPGQHQVPSQATASSNARCDRDPESRRQTK
jgi:hypothetical protein